MIQNVNVREVLSKSREQVAELIDYKEINLMFDDGVVLKTNGRELIYMDYFWDLVRAYPLTPMFSTDYVSTVLKGNMLHSGTHIELLSLLHEKVATYNNLDTFDKNLPVLEMLYSITNNINNDVAAIAERYVTSIDILSFIEVLDDPDIIEANKLETVSHKSIAESYEKLLKVINTSERLKNNYLVKAVRSKMVNSSQVMQCVGVRGYPTEVDGAILRNPILTNYTVGMRKVFDYIAESRSAAKALYFSESPLQDSEYFARRLQLLTMTLERIEHGDCGSTDYIHWRVNPPTKDDNGNVTYKGDLKFMVGQNYIDEASGKLISLKGDETHLYNKVIRKRSVMMCKHPNPHVVCSTCFGKLYINVSDAANLGQLTAATMTEQTTQSVLSTKHLDASSMSSSIVLDETANKYLSVNKAKNSYLVRRELKDRDVKLTVSRQEATGLTDILDIDDFDNISPIRISGVKFMDISFTSRNETMSIPIDISQGNRKAVFTKEFLRYLKEVKWTTDSKDNFVFDLKDWDFKLPVLFLPDMEYSFSDHSKQLAGIIESRMDDMRERATPDSPVATLQELFNLVNSKLNVNIVVLECIMYSCMVPENDETAMARNSKNPVLGVSGNIIKNRSLSNAYDYEGQDLTMTKPESFFKENRPDSVFDVFIKPREVVEHEKSKINPQH